MLAFKDKPAADAAWKAFLADPEWAKVRKITEANGALATKVDSVYLGATNYSPLK
jgi:hypothetical protein